MSDSPAWTTDVNAILVHPTDPAVWLHAGTTPLLHFRINDYLWFPDIEPVVDAVRERCSIDAIVLRSVDRVTDHPRRHQRLTWLLQPRSLAALPTGRWEPIATLALPDIPNRDTLLAALHTLDAPPSRTRRPWAARGWFEDAVAWAGAALQGAGLRQLSPPRQIRTWDLSTVIRFDTSAGPYFFKAALFTGAASTTRSVLFANEAALLDALPAIHPDHLPVPLATDPDRVWLLLPDAGSQLLHHRDLDRWEAALRLHARHQCAWSGQSPALLRAGCRDRRLSVFAGQLDAVFHDPDLLEHMDPPERHRLHAAAPTFHAMLAELHDLGIPETLIHGDLHAGNVALRDDHLTIFDWTDAAVSHPFFDLATFILESEFLDSIPGSRERLIAAYLDEWHDLAPQPALRRAAELTQPLGMLYQAIAYQHMLPDLEEPTLTPMARAGTHFLQLALDAFPQ